MRIEHRPDAELVVDAGHPFFSSSERSRMRGRILGGGVGPRKLIRLESSSGPSNFDAKTWFVQPCRATRLDDTAILMDQAIDTFRRRRYAFGTKNSRHRSGNMDENSIPRSLRSYSRTAGPRTRASPGRWALARARVRRRLKRLIQDEYIRVVAMTDPVKMGYNSEGLIGHPGRPRQDRSGCRRAVKTGRGKLGHRYNRGLRHFRLGDVSVGRGSGNIPENPGWQDPRCPPHRDLCQSRRQEAGLRSRDLDSKDEAPARLRRRHHDRSGYRSHS